MAEHELAGDVFDELLAAGGRDMDGARYPSALATITEPALRELMRNA